MTTRRTETPEARRRAALPPAGTRVLCAVSGGLDSMCLLHMLDDWRREGGGGVIAAHFNHCLRGAAADRDEEFVREICRRWNIPLTVGRGDVGAFAAREGQTVEEAARTLRYAFLRQAAEAEGCDLICTAHHADDNAETILLNLLRGTGLRGLTGMDRERDGLCRPLLDVTRAELADYAARWNIPHREDETNADPDAAARNLLRLRVMPLLKELNPRAVEHINRAAGQLRAADDALEAEARRRAACAEREPGRISLPAEALARAPEAVGPRMLLGLLDLLGVGRKDFGAVHLEAVLDLARRGGGQIDLPRGVTARCRRERLILETRPQPLTGARLIPNQPLVWGDYTLTLLERREGEGLALGPGGEAVGVGPCPAGERLTLPGSRGGRTVKRLCLDRGVSLAERETLPAVYVDGTLAAVWRLGVDVKFLPEGDRLRFVRIEKKREADRV
nr:tRNA lysidine(34) synthetase TilS [uncultured Oscillibacter sp.]